MPHGISEDVLVLGLYDTGQRQELITYDPSQDVYQQGTHMLAIGIRSPGHLPEGVVSARVRSNGDRVIHGWMPLYDQCKEIPYDRLPEDAKVGW